MKTQAITFFLMVIFSLLIVLSQGVAASTPIETSDENITKINHNVFPLLKKQAGARRNIPSSYGEKIGPRDADDRRCHSPGKPDCLLLPSKTIEIQYCTPSFYSTWWHNFLRQKIIWQTMSLPHGFDITMQEVEHTGGLGTPIGGCPDPVYYRPGRNNIYITYRSMEYIAEELNRNLDNSMAVTMNVRRDHPENGYIFSTNKRIAIDDDKIWDWVGDNCSGDFWENYDEVMDLTFEHEYLAHGYNLGHNPEGRATQKDIRCPPPGGFPNPDSSAAEWIMLDEYQP